MKQGVQFQTSSCFFKKALFEVKASGLQLNFNNFRQPSTWDKIKLSRVEHLDNRSRDMINFDFSEKGQGIASPGQCVYDLSRKMFLMLYSIK